MSVGETAAIRRGPYAENPAVGARGLRTQQRILDAALQVFAEHGYDRTTIDRIGQVAGCSRIAVYQYFAGKEDLFRALAGQVARQLRAAVEALDPITPDPDGLAAARAWVARYAAVHARYEPVFRAFDAAAAADQALLGGAEATAGRNAEFLQARLLGSTLPSRLRGPMVSLLTRSVGRAVGLSAVLRAAAPDAYPSERIEQVTAEVLHRVAFGLLPGVNDGAPGPVPPVLRMAPQLVARFDRVRALEDEALDPGRRALARLLEVGDDVVAGRGYRGVRVDHVVEAAGVSRGAFYRYFGNVEDFVQVVAARAVDEVSAVLADVPETHDRRSLRSWLRRYGDVHAAKGPMIRIWSEAMQDSTRVEGATVFDWGRRRLSGLLADRPHGDAEVEAVVLLAVVEAFGARVGTGIGVEEAVHVVERGFLTV